MFPRQIIIVILMLLAEIIYSSIKEKKRVEKVKKNRRKENDKFFRESKNLRETKYNNTNLPKEQEIDESIEYGNAINYNSNTLESEYKYEVSIAEGEEKINKSITKQEGIKDVKNKNIKSDVLRGIIFSEILSEPKSIKKKRGI